MAKTVIAVKAKAGESNPNILRRFSKKFRSSRISNKIRGDRYHKRDLSEGVKKKDKLKKIEKRKEIDRKIKFGKLTDRRATRINLSEKE